MGNSNSCRSGILDKKKRKTDSFSGPLFTGTLRNGPLDYIIATSFAYHFCMFMSCMKCQVGNRDEQSANFNFYPGNPTGGFIQDEEEALFG